MTGRSSSDPLTATCSSWSEPSIPLVTHDPPTEFDPVSPSMRTPTSDSEALPAGEPPSRRARSLDMFGPLARACPIEPTCSSGDNTCGLRPITSYMFVSGRMVSKHSEQSPHLAIRP
eukprot:9468131-Pyramimonas_sp.AAC.3